MLAIMREEGAADEPASPGEEGKNLKSKVLKKYKSPPKSNQK